MMMMMNDHYHSPTVQIPISQWDQHISSDLPSPFSDYPSLHRFLPSVADDASSDDLSDAFSCDHFRMFEFKVRRCSRGRSHDWTECPFAHPGEKARRRDPRRHHYSGTACPDFRKGACRRGDACEFAHGVFECWLHPARYRTQPCKDGLSCRRRVCFFAHTAAQLRLLSPPSSSSADHSPPESPRMMFSSPRSLSAAVRALQISSSPSSPPAWGFGGRSGGAWEEEAPMERVESGRNLRAIMYARLSMENSLGRDGADLDSSAATAAPDVGWISELVN